MKYTAPAKIILSGEHSVVYTKPAFVTAVDFHLTMSLEKGNMEKFDEKIHPALQHCDSIVQSYLQKNNEQYTVQPFKYSIDSNIPEGRGMGSSAAFCVAAIACLLHFYAHKEYDKQTINSLAYQAEKYFHGIPSGVDVSASCFGGLIFYRKEFEFLKTISSLNFKIPKHFEENILMIDTGKPVESTKEMVAHVGKRYNQNPREIEKILADIEKVTKRMVVSIVKEDLSLFKSSIEENEILLEQLGIVSKSTKKFIQELQLYGVGKVTGAGGIQDGSGFILFYTEDMNGLKKFLSKEKISYLQFKQDYNGVKAIY